MGVVQKTIDSRQGAIGLATDLLGQSQSDGNRGGLADGRHGLNHQGDDGLLGFSQRAQNLAEGRSAHRGLSFSSQICSETSTSSAHSRRKR